MKKREVTLMSVSRWFYQGDICESSFCCGDCDHCDIARNPEEYGIAEAGEED